MYITVFGAGYVGLVTSACLAEVGNYVICVDSNRDKISKLNRGILPIYEPGLEPLLDKNKKDGRLRFTYDVNDGLVQTEVVFIAVGTPEGENGEADMSHVLNVAQDIGMHIKRNIIIVDKSTVPVGTAEVVKAVIRQEIEHRGLPNMDIEVLSNPEFLREGSAINDFMHPDRVVIGAETLSASKTVQQLYKVFVESKERILLMDTKSAELTKYAANAMLAARISFMNEIARLCDKTGADIMAVQKGIGMDKRIGRQFLSAGLGYGGSCFPKDVKELIKTGERHGESFELIKAIREVNEQQKLYLVNMILQRFGQELSGRKFGVWGLSFKPETDDVRESPAIVIINALVEKGAAVSAYDPKAIEQAQKILSHNIDFTESMYQAADIVDALLIVTDWEEFKQADFSKLKYRMKNPIIFDGRNMLDPLTMRQLGFEYYGIGRGRCVK